MKIYLEADREMDTQILKENLEINRLHQIIGESILLALPKECSQNVHLLQTIATELETRETVNQNMLLLENKCLEREIDELEMKIALLEQKSIQTQNYIKTQDYCYSSLAQQYQEIIVGLNSFLQTIEKYSASTLLKNQHA